jgi:hypothetical protein
MIFVRHRANMDIQFITDPYGCAVYVTNYMCKSNANASTIVKKAIKELNANRNVSIRERLMTLASKFTNCAEVSAPECVYTLLSMSVSRCSREMIYINTFPIKDRLLMLQEYKILKDKHADSTDVYKKTLHEYYQARPKTTDFEKMCMAEFAGFYEFISNARYDQIMQKKMPKYQPDLDDAHDDDETGDEVDNHNVNNLRAEQNTSQTFFQLLNKLGWIRKREKCRILRYKRYNKDKESNDYYRVDLMLYLPFRNENMEIEVENTIDIYKKNKTTIAENKANFESVVAKKYDDIVERMDRELEEHNQMLNEQQADEWTMKQDEVVQDYDGDNESFEEQFGYQANIVDLEINQHQDIAKQDLKKIKTPQIKSETEYNELMRNLNKGQHMYIMNVLRSMKDDKQFCHFISGQAGVGKSRLIDAIFQAVTRLFNPNKDEEKVIVALTAYTGKAASNIKVLLTNFLLFI